jgi:putative membrane protein
LLYALLAPWSVSLDTGWTVFPVLMLTLAFLFGMELTAEVIEEPFGTQGDDLPLDDLCATSLAAVGGSRDRHAWGESPSVAIQ